MLNSFELLLVQNDLEARGIRDYHIRPGNASVWVGYRGQYGQTNCYYLFKDGEISDVIYD